MTIRKNITLSKNDYDTISDFANANGYSFSEILRKATLNFIKQEEELQLSEFLFSHVDSVSKEEQKEIDALNINFDDKSGRELDLNDIL